MSWRLTLLAIASCLALAACGGSSSTPSPAVAVGSPTAGVPSPSVPSSATARPTPTETQAVAAPCTARTLKFDPAKLELTGPWLGDDAGIYYLRQIGTTLWWNGMSGQSGPPAMLGREWNNVATGQIKDDLTIDLQWADVPRGQILGGGTLVWKIVDDGSGSTKLTKQTETGTGFGATVMTPCTQG